MRISLWGKLFVALLTVGLGIVVGSFDVSQIGLMLPAALLLASGVLLGALNRPSQDHNLMAFGSKALAQMLANKTGGSVE